MFPLQSIIRSLETLNETDRERVPLLAYYCQGHCLGLLDFPLFEDTIRTADTGIHIDAHTEAPDENEALPETIRALIEMVVGEYGKHSMESLAAMVRSDPAWVEARTGNGEISQATMTDSFRASARIAARRQTRAGYPVPDPVDHWQSEWQSELHPESMKSAGEVFQGLRKRRTPELVK